MIMWIIAGITWAMMLACTCLAIFVWFGGIDKMVNWSLKRWPIKPEKPDPFPTYLNYEEWMREQVAYYRKAFPREAWQLFSPYNGSYLPIFVACGPGWKTDDSTLLAYRKIKEENPDLVAKAIKNRPKGFAYVISRVGDAQDYDFNIRLYS